MSRERYHVSGDPKNLYWYYETGSVWPLPFCTKHQIAMICDSDDKAIICIDCLDGISLGIFTYAERRRYVHQKIEGLKIAKYKAVRLETEGSAVLAREEIVDNDDYFVDAKLSDTGGGLQLMVLVGKKDKSGKKVQLFVEPGTKRLNFDRNETDMHPTGIFTRIVAQFKDSSQVITAEGDRNTATE